MNQKNPHQKNPHLRQSINLKQNQKMKIFKYTAYSLIGAAALLSLGACSPDEVELEPIPFELSYYLYSEYNYGPTDYTTVETNAAATEFKLGANQYNQIHINLNSNTGYNSSVTFDIETPDWVTTNSNYLDLYSYNNTRLGKVTLDLFGYSYGNTVRINGEEYNTYSNNTVTFAFAPNPGNATRTGNIKISVNVAGATGSVTVPVSQTGSADAAAPKAISFSTSTTQYGDTSYEVYVDYPETSSNSQYYLMVTPLRGNVTGAENVLRYMGAYAWMLQHNQDMALCEYFETISKNNFMEYNTIYCESFDYKAIPGGTRYSFQYTNGYNFNGFSHYAVYTVTMKNGTATGFNTTVFDSNGNIVE